jgi:hypothetical protein
MARDTPQQNSKKQTMGTVVSVISVSSALAVFNFSWKFRDDVEKIVNSQARLFKPSRDEIREVCKELVDTEKERARDKERELRELLDYFIKLRKREY